MRSAARPSPTNESAYESVVSQIAVGSPSRRAIAVAFAAASRSPPAGLVTACHAAAVREEYGAVGRVTVVKAGERVVEHPEVDRILRDAA